MYIYIYIRIDYKAKKEAFIDDLPAPTWCDPQVALVHLPAFGAVSSARDAAAERPGGPGPGRGALRGSPEGVTWGMGKPWVKCSKHHVEKGFNGM